MSADQDAWENNRLLTSGAVREKEVSLTFDDGQDQRVQLIVHSLKPPFLDGRVSFSLQQVLLLCHCCLVLYSTVVMRNARPNTAIILSIF